MDNSFFTELDQQLEHAQDLTTIWTFFFNNRHRIQQEWDHSLKHGAVIYPHLAHRIIMSCNQCFGDGNEPFSNLYRTHPMFYHGILRWPNKTLGTVIFSAQCNRGVIAAHSLLVENQVEYVRFRLAEDIDTPSVQHMH